MTARLTPGFTVQTLRALLPASVDAYEADSRAQGHTEATIDRRLKLFARVNADAITRGLGSLDEMTREDVTRYLSRPELGTSSKGTYFSYLRNYFDFLVATDRLVRSPMAGMKPPKQNLPVPRPLQPEPLERVLAITDEPWHTAVRLALYAGLRAMEIAALTRADINEEFIEIKGKGGKSAHLPTHPAIWETVRDRGPGPLCPDPATGGHLSAQDMSCGYAQYVTKLGLPKTALHRLRHTYATKLLRGGVNIRVVQELMRHSSLATTARYTAVDEAEKRAALTCL